MLASGSVPTRWSETRVALIPKTNGDSRPISLAAVSWRIGAKALVKQLRLCGVAHVSFAGLVARQIRWLHDWGGHGLLIFQWPILVMDLP